MCKAPKPPKPASAPVIIDGSVDETAITERDRIKRKRVGMRGSQSTMLTSGVQYPQTAGVKSALGQ